MILGGVLPDTTPVQLAVIVVRSDQLRRQSRVPTRAPTVLLDWEFGSTCHVTFKARERPGEPVTRTLRVRVDPFGKGSVGSAVDTFINRGGLVGHG